MLNSLFYDTWQVYSKLISNIYKRKVYGILKKPYLTRIYFNYCHLNIKNSKTHMVMQYMLILFLLFQFRENSN